MVVTNNHPEASRWLAQAHEDLLTAEANLREERHYAVALFAQQAVEKALKAVIIVQTHQMAPKIHDVRELSQLARLPGDFHEDIERLVPTYMTSRYPDAIEGNIPAQAFKEADATLLLAIGRRVVQWVTSQM